MLEFLKDYSGNILINNTKIVNKDFAKELDKYEGEITIKLIPEKCVDTQISINNTSEEYLFYVQSWMLDKSTPELPFMKMCNNDKPMPLRCMQGEIVKQTPRMYYVRLHGTDNTYGICACCGRTLINPISKLISIGPECCIKLGINSNIFIKNQLSQEEKEYILKSLENKYWEGWIPKTAILKVEKV